MVDISEFFETRVKSADLSSGDNELALEADTNESYVVRDFGLDGADADTIATVSIGEESMFAFPCGDGEDTLFREDSLESEMRSLYGYMRMEGLAAPPLQVPEGETLKITNDSNSGTCTVVYEQGGPSLASASAPGGPDTKRRLYPVTGQTTVNISSSSTQETFDGFGSEQPAEFDDFPFGTDCPSNREYDLLGTCLFISDDNTSGASLDDFRLLTEEQKPLAQDGNFVSADFADYPDQDFSVLPMLYSGMPTLTPGDELDLEVRATSGSGTGDVTIRATHLLDRRPI